MDKPTFRELIILLKPHLKATNCVSLEEQVMLFLFVVGNSASNQLSGERFQHSGETISHYFNKV
ncbi:hypothetical protein CROQUDRAFT_666453 [Cronartium quercuum f. sp. fusiforme G11]|uniref:DUF8040 domain-containing protein n=1 Tax=Cronartium quercuum f. sp. fusiforme G11 TaxID=708437 RepID=A0A9P6N5B6_9BASI|nr:hypothetical protein CROQUDRAFT_666453 [Cronartium quercuum f. sp. fusiforme G11]